MNVSQQRSLWDARYQRTDSIGSSPPFCRERLSCRYGGADRRRRGNQSAVALQALFRQAGYFRRHCSPNGSKGSSAGPPLPDAGGKRHGGKSRRGNGDDGAGMRLQPRAVSGLDGGRIPVPVPQDADAGTVPRPGNGKDVRSVFVRRASHVSDGYFPASGGFAGGGTPAGTGILRSHVSIIQCIRWRREKRGGAAGSAFRPLHGKDERTTRRG